MYIASVHSLKTSDLNEHIHMQHGHLCIRNRKPQAFVITSLTDNTIHNIKTLTIQTFICTTYRFAAKHLKACNVCSTVYGEEGGERSPFSSDFRNMARISS